MNSNTSLLNLALEIIAAEIAQVEIAAERASADRALGIVDSFGSTADLDFRPAATQEEAEAWAALTASERAFLFDRAAELYFG